MKGYLFVFEGADGVGKTSIIEKLCNELKNSGFNSSKFGFPGYHEGTLGQLISKIHHNANHYVSNKIDPTSLQLLHIAAHIDTIKKLIIPALEENEIVLLDRFWWSTFIYGKISEINEDILIRMIEIEKYYWDSIVPNKLFLINRLKHPLKNEISVLLWNKLKLEYSDLAYKENGKYPIIEVINENKLEDIIEVIIKEILLEVR
jgi:thymidylate kinase